MADITTFKKEGYETEKVKLGGLRHFFERTVGLVHNNLNLAERISRSAETISMISWDYYWNAGYENKTDLGTYKAAFNRWGTDYPGTDLVKQRIRRGNEIRAFVAPRHISFEDSDSYRASLEWIKTIDLEPDVFFPPRKLSENLIRFPLIEICGSEFYIAPSKNTLFEKTSIVNMPSPFGGRIYYPQFEEK